MVPPRLFNMVDQAMTSFHLPRAKRYCNLGYGGFSISVNPFFSPSILTFLQKYGAVLAVPNIRGGAEFGEEWHKAGIREQKVRAPYLSFLILYP
jgi:prolyl oligopeptidase PreP (S9A serine peptidase family)